MGLLAAYKLIGRDNGNAPTTWRHPRHSKTSQESLDPWGYQCAADHADAVGSIRRTVTGLIGTNATFAHPMIPRAL